MRRERLEKLLQRLCPHCHGRLRETPQPDAYDIMCTVCHRGWWIDRDGNWLALFDAGGHVYDKKGKLIAVDEQALPYYDRYKKQQRRFEE